MPTAAAAVRYLLSLPGEIRKRNFGLRRMRQLMDALGRPDRDPGIVHVAGTNGKGSTAAMIESGLRADGRTTGLYSSPHLSRINERFLLDGQPASDETLARAIEPVRRASERLVAEYGGGAHPTFFEFATAVSLVLFRQARVRHRIVETGLGGRLDASNVVLPELAVLTARAVRPRAVLGTGCGLDCRREGGDRQGRLHGGAGQAGSSRAGGVPATLHGGWG